ncbi:MAG: hypothetical protein ACFFE8_08535 [Candidatus Heimdallarchaeota archaeon]
MTLETRIQEDLLDHLQRKALLTQELTDLGDREKKMREILLKFQQHAVLGEIEQDIDFSISELTEEKNELSKRLNKLQDDILYIKEVISKLEVAKKDLEESIIILQQQKNDFTEELGKLRGHQHSSKKVGMKVKSQKQRLHKLKKRFEDQNQIKKNLESIIGSLEIIERVIAYYWPLTEGKKTEIDDIPNKIDPNIIEKIIEANKTFHEAKLKFDSNSPIPFLVDADKAYRQSIEALIRLSERLPDNLIKKEFSTQVLTIVSSGFSLNTRHLNSVRSMIEKLESGLEISPLASFANEIKEYFESNLTLLRIPGSPISLNNR